MDSFVEYMIKRKKTVGAILRVVGIMFAALLISSILSLAILIFIPSVLSILPLMVLGIFYLAYRISTSFDLEFEYILTNGELDIDKIINRKRRKRLLTVHCKTFIKFGKTDSEEYANFNHSDFTRIVDASANSESYEDYYAVFYDNGQKILLIFNPTAKMIDIFKVFAPRVVL